MSEATPTPENTPAQSPTPAPTPASAPAGDDVAKKALEALQKQQKEIETKLAAYQQKEQEELDKQKTAEQRKAELEQELKETKRAALVERVRRVNGFADKVFDAVTANGETEDEIKAAYEAHKTALDEYVKAQAPKPGQGGGTVGAAPGGKEEQKNVPRLVAAGFIKPKQAV
jgi:hypothetical protein